MSDIIKTTCSLKNIVKYRTSLMGISILFIMFFHSFIGWPRTPITRFFIRGEIGVEFFLILSAIGMYYSLSKNGNISQFYKRRIIRILPTYLFVAIPIYLFFAQYTEDGYENLFWDITTLSCFWGRIRYWFIHIIFICYLISPFYKKYVDSHYSTIFVPVCLAFLSVAFAYIFPQYEIVISRVPIFLLGFHLAKIIKQRGEENFVWYPLLMLVLVFVYLYVMSYVRLPMIWHRLLFFAVSIPMLISFANILPFISDTFKRLLDFLGNHTLELYLVHESVCTTIVWKYYHENVYIYALVCIVMAIPLAIIVKQVCSYFGKWSGIQ